MDLFQLKKLITFLRDNEDAIDAVLKDVERLLSKRQKKISAAELTRLLDRCKPGVLQQVAVMRNAQGKRTRLVNDVEDEEEEDEGEEEESQSLNLQPLEEFQEMDFSEIRSTLDRLQSLNSDDFLEIPGGGVAVASGAAPVEVAAGVPSPAAAVGAGGGDVPSDSAPAAAVGAGAGVAASAAPSDVAVPPEVVDGGPTHDLSNYTYTGASTLSRKKFWEAIVKAENSVERWINFCAKGVTIRIDGKNIRFNVDDAIARGRAGDPIDFKALEERSALEEMAAFIAFGKICENAFVALGREQGGHESEDRYTREKERNLCKLASLLRRSPLLMVQSEFVSMRVWFLPYFETGVPLVDLFDQYVPQSSLFCPEDRKLNLNVHSVVFGRVADNLPTRQELDELAFRVEDDGVVLDNNLVQSRTKCRIQLEASPDDSCMEALLKHLRSQLPNHQWTGGCFLLSQGGVSEQALHRDFVEDSAYQEVAAAAISAYDLPLSVVRALEIGTRLIVNISPFDAKVDLDKLNLQEVYIYPSEYCLFTQWHAGSAYKRRNVRQFAFGHPPDLQVNRTIERLEYLVEQQSK